MLNRIRAWLFGRCPKCRSVRTKQVEGWQKVECRDCRTMWTY